MGRVVFGGVTSGELIATLFFLGLGEKASVCPSGISWRGIRLLAVSSCVSMGVGVWLVEGLPSSFWLEVVIGLGIVRQFGRSLGVFCGALMGRLGSEGGGNSDEVGSLGV